MPRSRLLALAALAAAVVTSIGLAPGSPPRVTVMTWNIYYGGGADSGFADMGDIFESVLATDFNQRATRLARIIDQQKPHIVCLQEVARWQTEDFFGDERDDIDFLEILQTRLLSRGLTYDIVGTLDTIDFTAPGEVDGDLLDIRWTERLVVLARRSSHLQVGTVRTRRYDEIHSIAIPVVGPLEFNRGWIAADITFKGRKARYVCTHLEALSESVREAQAAQLLDWLSGTNLRVIVAGDMNALPASGVYQQFTNTGYSDAWIANHGMFDGPTCCQSGDLANASSELNRRIDQVWLRGALSPVSSSRIGQRQEDRAPSGLWPSDHAGVVAKISLN